MGTNIFEVLCGEFVKITLNVTDNQIVELDGRLKTIGNLLTVKGFLIDMDDEFYYLGLEPNVLNRCVPRTKVCLIDISDPDEDQINYIEELIPTPKDIKSGH
jgi:hypothetical protein